MERVLLLCLIFSPTSLQRVNDESNESIAGRTTRNCTEEVRNEAVYIGWPHSLSCDVLEKQWQTMMSPNYPDSMEAPEYNTENPFEQNATCVIWDLENNRILYNKTANLTSFSKLSYDIKNFSHDTPRSYLLEGWLSGKASECIAIKNNLNVTKLPALSCWDSYNLSTPGDRVGKVMNGASFRCLVPRSIKPNIHKHILPNYTVTWYRDCGRLPEGHFLTGHWKDELRLSSLTYEHPGIYSCAVTHNGMQRFIYHSRLCVAPAQESSQHTVTCTKKAYHVTMGKKIVIECRGNTELNNAFHVVVQWSKADGNAVNCTNHVEGEATDHNHDRVTCSYRMDTVCFHRVPSHSERQSPPKVVIMRLVINDVDVDDLGWYTVKMTTTVKGSVPAEVDVLLKQDYIPFLLGNVKVIVACGILFVIIMMLVFIIWWRKIHIRIFCRRKLEPYQPETKLYGAYLSYYFSYDLDTFAQRQTRDVIAFVRDELERLGYKIYDETKDNYDVEMRANKAITKMKQSHRIIVIMTSEYVKDQWSVSTLQKGFEEMIMSESKMIFILLPGMKEHIKQHATDDDTYRMIRRAINMNYSLGWSHSHKFDEKLFSLSLELAMPKLRSQTLMRHASTSSSVSSQLVLYKNELVRTISSDTGSTIINSPVAKEGMFVEFTIDSEANEETVVASQ